MRFWNDMKVIEESEIDENRSAFGNCYHVIGKEQIDALLSGKILYWGGEYGTFIRFDPELDPYEATKEFTQIPQFEGILDFCTTMPGESYQKKHEELAESFRELRSTPDVKIESPINDCKLITEIYDIDKMDIGKETDMLNKTKGVQ